MLYKVGNVFVFLLFAYAVIGQVRYACDKDACTKKENVCPEVNCTEGRLLMNAPPCGCCHVCIKSLKSGEQCKTDFYNIEDIERTGECGPGLICNKKTKICESANTTCINKEKKPSKVSRYKEQIFPEFDCDDFGYFNLTVCIPGVMCHCVNKEGNRIFGTDLEVNNGSMACDCSREINEFRSTKSVADEHLPRCLPNGNYDPIQCSDTTCFCMDTELDLKKDAVSINDSLKALPCYNHKIHENRLTRCQQERAKQMEIFKNKTYKAVIGADVPRCDLDGSYFPRQCIKNKCYCVNKNGKKYPGYEASRSEEAEMTCRCPRDKDILNDATKKTRNMRLFKEIQCNTLGNYETKTNQVIESVFFKIDKNGI